VSDGVAVGTVVDRAWRRWRTDTLPSCRTSCRSSQRRRTTNLRSEMKAGLQRTNWTELNWPTPSWPSYTTCYWSHARQRHDVDWLQLANMSSTRFSLVQFVSCEHALTSTNSCGSITVSRSGATTINCRRWTRATLLNCSSKYTANTNRSRLPFSNSQVSFGCAARSCTCCG